MSSRKRFSNVDRRRVRLGMAMLSAVCSMYAGSVGAQYPPPRPEPPPMPAPPSTTPGAPSAFVMTPLVSNGAVIGTANDPNLINPWGVAAAPDSPIWVANNATQHATAYDGAGNIVITVALPAGMNGLADPTGLVSNGSQEFVIDNGSTAAPATFILDGEGGTLLAWAQSVDAANAIIAYDDGQGGAVYKGLAIAANGDASLLYATDFRNGKVDVFNGQFQKVQMPGGFADPQLPEGYAPFGIHTLSVEGETVIFVSYAQHTPDTPDEEVEGAGLGVVNLFDTNGTLLTNLVGPGAQLNAPWGAVVAPPEFGSFGNMLLIGNFGDGVINAFDATTGAFVDTVKDASGQPIVNDGLWGLIFGNGTNDQPATSLYFTAGIAEEAAGVYGHIDVQR
jgi:uncharacterized protein (TIGR03118 family)